MINVNSEPILSHERSSQLEVPDLRIVHVARSLRSGNNPQNYGDVIIIERYIEDNQTVVDIAAEADEWTYGIKDFYRVEGTIIVNGKPVKISSEEIGASHTIFINGLVMDIASALNYVMLPSELISRYQNMGVEHVIWTRTHDLMAFDFSTDEVI